MKAAKASPKGTTLLDQLPGEAAAGRVGENGFPHSARVIYDQAFALGHVPPNGRGPWPKVSDPDGWDLSDLDILRQEMTGRETVNYIADLVGRHQSSVEAMAVKLGLLDPTAQLRRRPVLRDNPLANSCARFAAAIASYGSALDSARLPSLKDALAKNRHARWTAEMDQHLRQNYRSEPAKSIAETIGVTVHQVSRRADYLGLRTKQPTWTREETVFLLEYIQTEPMRWIAEQLGRSLPAVSLRPKQLGIFPGWTRKDDSTLLKHRKTRSFAQIGKLIRRPAYAVEHRVRFLTDDEFDFSRAGLERLFVSRGRAWLDGLIYLPVREASENVHRWSEADKEFLRKNYTTMGGPLCADHLGVTPSKVRRKALVLGLSAGSKGRQWTSVEEEWLRKNINKLTRQACAKKLGRSTMAVSVKASALKILSPRTPPVRGAK